MKKSFKVLMAVAAAAVALVSCSKEETIVPATQNEDGISVTINTGAPVTMTMMSGTTPYWCDGDILGVSNGTSTNVKFAENSIPDGETATTATFSGTVSSAGTYYAYYPHTDNGVVASGAKVDISASQYPTATSFDGSADIMVSKSFTISTNSATTIDNLQFARLGAIVKIVLTDTESTMVGTQHPTTVSMTAESNLVGRVYIDMVNQTLGDLYSGQSTTVTANYTAETKYAINGSNATYLIVYPQTLTAGSTLTIAASTEDYAIEKEITVPSGGIELAAGKVNTLNISLLSSHITADSGDSLPFNDSFSWQTSSGNSEMSFDSSPAIPSSKYSAFYKVFQGSASGVARLSTGSATGFLTTVELDLRSAFYVHVNSKYWSDSDATKLYVSVDDGSPQEITLTSAYDDYYVNFAAATKKSKVKVTTTSNKRAYIKAFDVISGTYVFPPEINVTSDNPMAIANTASSQTIEYTIVNPTAATLTAALQDPADTWISNIDYSGDGEVTFDVAAQTSGAAARSAVIVLSYTGADDVEVTVNQAAGAGGTTTKTFTIASASVVSTSSYAKYEATVDTRGWIITFGGNSKSVGTNSKQRTNCTLSSYSKYAVSPVTTSSTASAFASTTSISNVKKISYTISGGKNQNSTNVYVLYSSDNTTFSKLSLTAGTQGAAISSGTEYEFAKCSGYFALLFQATNDSGDWRIDDVNITFTYED